MKKYMVVFIVLLAVVISGCGVTSQETGGGDSGGGGAYVPPAHPETPCTRPYSDVIGVGGRIGVNFHDVTANVDVMMAQFAWGDYTLNYNYVEFVIAAGQLNKSIYLGVNKNPSENAGITNSLTITKDTEHYIRVIFADSNATISDQAQGVVYQINSEKLNLNDPTSTFKWALVDPAIAREYYYTDTFK